MKRLRKFLSLTSSDRCLLVNTLFLLEIIRLGLKLLPLQALRRFLARMAQPTAKLQQADQASVDKVIWTVTVASRYIRGVRCLAQALAAQVLLGRHGYSSCLHIGVARGKGGKLFAHAWVESQGRIVIGSSGDMSHYTLVPLQERENYERDCWYLFS